MATYHFISIALAVICFVGTLVLGVSTTILRESGDSSPYSFSKVQLWLWSLVILPAFCLHWGYAGDAVPSINETALILLGISGGTTLAAAAVAKAQSASAAGGSLKGALPKENFWVDILKDDKGNLSMVRLQQLLFTIVYIGIYVSLFFKNGEMHYPDFTNGGNDHSAFVLMGISTGTYVIGKSLNK